MAKNGCSKFFLTNFAKKTGINSEWPKMCILNLLKPFWYKKTGSNLEWPKMGILNYLNLSSAKKLEEIWNGKN